MNKIFKIGKKWMRIDNTGIMGWTGRKNFFFLPKKKDVIEYMACAVFGVLMAIFTMLAM
jgi:hypothetical protein